MSSGNTTAAKLTNYLQEFSIPLIAGVVFALSLANVAPHFYHDVLHWQPFGALKLLGHKVDLHFLVNDIFMVFFFGIAAKEITESCLPGGSLNPPRKAINPLFATLGGVFGPVSVYFAGYALLRSGVFGAPISVEAAQGWGIPTATDIALAWLVARMVFGRGHPAVDFLLLLAVADDAIGLGIIAVFYGDPSHPVEPVFLSLVVLAMGIAFLMRRFCVSSWLPYIFVAGPVAWLGLMLAHLHPSLALAAVVPFLPGPKRDTGLFIEQDEKDLGHSEDHSPLHMFEHQTKIWVDFGLFFFALCNAGVAFDSVGSLSFLVLTALVVGKLVGISLFGWVAARLGFPLPAGMGLVDLAMVGLIAAIGLTVALFVSGVAFVDPALAAEAKMGALLSGLVGFLVLALGRVRSLAQRDIPASISNATQEPSTRAA